MIWRSQIQVMYCPLGRMLYGFHNDKLGPSFMRGVVVPRCQGFLRGFFPTVNDFRREFGCGGDVECRCAWTSFRDQGPGLRNWVALASIV